MRELEQATGLTAGSLYKAFGSKREIYRRCVDQYMSEKSYLAVLKGMHDAPLRDALAAVIEAVIESVDPPAERAAGCLVTNHAAELLQLEPELAHEAVERLTEVQTEICDRLRRAQQTGELRSHHDIGALGAFLMTMLQGMLILAATTRDVEGMRKSRDLMLGMLN